MASFNLNPRIYSLLICSQVGRDALTGGWQLNPLSHLAVHTLPVPVDMVLVANIMAPPGDYEVACKIFHVDDKERALLAQPIRLTIQPGKNVEFLAKVSVTLRETGLYLVEASLVGHDVAYAPIRISNVEDVVSSRR